MGENVSRYEDLLERVPCNLCGLDDYRVITPARLDQASLDNVVETFRSSGDQTLLDQLVECKGCGLLYINPRLNPSLILRAYSEGSDETFVSQATSRERTFGKCMDLIGKYAPTPGLLADIGTAAGSFLHVARQRGWEVKGCEPSRWLSEWGSKHYGLSIVPGTIFDMGLEEGSCDVVTLWDVLEHTPDPKKVLEECRRILKPGGLLVVNFPDIGSLPARLMGRKWVFLLSVHLYYFTKATVGKMLSACGFDVVKTKLHWQTLEIGYIFFRMKPYVGWASTIGTRIVEFFGLGHVQIPYWVGQTLVVARKGKP